MKYIFLLALLTPSIAFAQSTVDRAWQQYNYNITHQYEYNQQMQQQRAVTGFIAAETAQTIIQNQLLQNQLIKQDNNIYVAPELSQADKILIYEILTK